jgi:hypothetical protein
VRGAVWDIGDTGAAVVRGDARARLSSKLPFHVDAQGARFSLYQLFRALHFSAGPWVEGRVAGSVAADGALVPFTIAGHGDGVVDNVVVADRDVRSAGIKHRVVALARPVHVDVGFRADQTSLSFVGNGDDGMSRVDAAATLFVAQARGFVLDATTSSATFATVQHRVGPLELGGHGGGVLHIEGPYARPLATAKVHINDVVVDDFALGDGIGRIEATPNTFALHDVLMQKKSSRYRADVGLDFKSPMRVRVDVTLLDARAEDLREIVPEHAHDAGLVALRKLALTGPLTGTLHAAGPIADGSGKHIDGAAALAAGKGASLLGAKVDKRALHLRLEHGGLHVDGVR